MRGGQILVTLIVVASAGLGVGVAAGHGGATPVAVAHLHRLFAVPVGDGSSNNTPSAAGGAVFVSACNSGGCSLSRRSETNGAVVWRASVGVGATSPQVAGLSVVVATPASVAAYDANTGRRRWSHATAASVTQLLADPTRVYAAETAGQDITYPASIEVFDATDGHRLWSKPQGTWQTDQLLALAGAVVDANHSVGQTFRGVDEYAAATGQFIRRVARCHVGVVANGLLYSGASACDPHTGNVVWSDPTTGGAADPAVGGQQLDLPIIDSHGNPALRAYAATTGLRLWTHAATPNGASPNSQPTIAAGVVYAATASFAPPSSYRRTLTAFRQSDGAVLAAVSVPGSAGAQAAPHVVIANSVVLVQVAGVLYGYSA